MSNCPKCGAPADGEVPRAYACGSYFAPGGELSYQTATCERDELACQVESLRAQLADAEEENGRLREACAADLDESMQKLNAAMEQWGKAEPPPEIPMTPFDKEAVLARIVELHASRGATDDSPTGVLLTAKVIMDDHAARLKPVLYRKEYCEGVMNGFADAQRILDCCVMATSAALASPSSEGSEAK